MKLTNPILAKQIRSWYKNNWSHEEVKKYLAEHHDINVNKRTLKRWKKCMNDISWQGPTKPNPPVPNTKATEDEILRICTLRKKTGWGSLPLKYIFDLLLGASPQPAG